MEPTFCTIVRDLDPSYRPLRGGVIPVIQTPEKKILFGLGVDRISQQLTDFAGGIKYLRLKENPIQGALREFHEETLGIFGDLTPGMVENCLVLYNQEMLVIFIAFDLDQNLCSQIFESLFGQIMETKIRYGERRRRKLPEITSIEWLSYPELRYLVDNRREQAIYSKLKTFLARARDFFDYL